jgi:hypothetical protein
MCNGINVNSIPPTQLLHTFSYIVAILIHNHCESPKGSYIRNRRGYRCYRYMVTKENQRFLLVYKVIDDIVLFNV